MISATANRRWKTRQRFNSIRTICILAAIVPLASGKTSAQEYDFFEKKIRPVLVDHCYKCHSATSEKLKGELLLDTKEGTLKGGESGKPAIVPGDAERSLLIEAIRYNNEDLQMPPPKQGKLSENQIADFVAWINSGAPDPRTGISATRDAQLSMKSHWAFQPPQIPPIPKIKGHEW